MTDNHFFEHEDEEDMTVFGSKPLQYGHPEPDPIRVQVLERRASPEFVSYMQDGYLRVQAADDPDQVLGCDVTEEIKR